VQPVFRFAPSPTGHLHLGHAYSALLDYELCQKTGGRFLLRIEDTDLTRCRPEYEAAIYDDLRWVGLTWEEPVRRQSEHFAAYRAALDRLKQLGLVYPSFMTRAEIEATASDPSWPRDPDGTPLYPGTERTIGAAAIAERIAAGTPLSQRLFMDRAVELVGPLSWIEEGFGDRQALVAHPEAWGDVVIARKDTPTSYHLSVVIDDALQGVTNVVRGRDLFHATSIHVLLQRLLGLPSPVYHHHRLIVDASGRKLSKSDRDMSVRSLREAGKTVEDVRRMVGIGSLTATPPHSATPPP
jgi:glutamyl-Q tRNA(Asp) synthetase